MKGLEIKLGMIALLLAANAAGAQLPAKTPAKPRTKKANTQSTAAAKRTAAI